MHQLYHKFTPVLLGLLLTLLSAAAAQAQCASLHRLFSSLHNRSEEDVLRMLRSDPKEFQLVSSQHLPDFWEKPEYLHGDSVLRSRITYRQRYIECFGKQEVEVQLLFADDKLFDVTLLAYFEAKDKRKGEILHQELRDMYSKQLAATSLQSSMQASVSAGATQSALSPAPSRKEVMELSFEYENTTTQGGTAMKEGGRYVLQVTALNFNQTKLDYRSYQ